MGSGEFPAAPITIAIGWINAMDKKSPPGWEGF
jgi:hypothetical protein